jgi:hypothetical protein
VPVRPAFWPVSAHCILPARKPCTSPGGFSAARPTKSHQAVIFLLPMTAPLPPVRPSPLHCAPLRSLTHHGKMKLIHRISGFPSLMPFPLQLQWNVAINGLHSTSTSDLPRPLTSRRPRPIKGTLEHHLHTTFPFLASAHSIRAHIALPSSSVIAHLLPTVGGSPLAVHRPTSHSVRTPQSSSLFPPTLNELPPTGVAVRPDSSEPFSCRHQ